MNASTKRSLLRWFHLLLAIPILGFIYSPMEVVAPYVNDVRYFFVPVVMFSGFWMWRGYGFAFLGVALWLGVFSFAGFGWALLGQIALFLGVWIWGAMRKRRSR
jgi:hypothetical protein